MINNYFCNMCNKYSVCSWEKSIDAFSEDKKKRIGVSIKVESCEEYEKAETEDDNDE